MPNKPSPKSPLSPSELVANINTQLEQYSGLFDFETQKQRAKNELITIRAEIEGKHEQLKVVINEIKTQERSLARFSSERSAELDREHERKTAEAGAKYQQRMLQYEQLSTTLNETISSIRSSEQHLAEINEAIIDQSNLNSYLFIEHETQLEEIASATAEIDTLRGRILELKADHNDVIDGYDKDSHNLANERSAAETELNGILTQLNEAKRKFESEQGRYATELKQLRATIEETKREETQRQRDMETERLSLSAKAAGLAEERQKFEQEKRRSMHAA